MLRKNEYHIEPGVYKHENGAMIVVTELVTHQFVNGAIEKKTEPEVVYRDLVMQVETYITYSMKLSEFNKKFIQV